LSNVIKSFQINKKEEESVQLFKEEKQNKDAKSDSNLTEQNLHNQEQQVTKQDEEKFKKRQAAMTAEAKREAEMIIEEAKKEAKRIKEMAQQEAEEIKNEAYQSGLQQGKAEVMEQGWDEIKSLINRLENATDELEAETKEKLDGLSDEVLELTIAITKKVIKQELSLDQTIINNLVEEALSLLNGEKEVIVKVNLADLNVIKSYQERLLSLNSNLEEVRFVVDNEIEVGGCIVETDFGGLDATITSQLDKIANRLLEVNNYG